MMTVLHNDLFLRALKCLPTPRTPIWLMRQAGRYLPEYRALRKKAGDFLSLCKNPEWACEATLQPLSRFNLDAAIIFSDILTVPDAMGLGLYFSEGEGPRFERPVQDAETVKKLPIVDPHRELKYVMEALSVTKKALRGRVPLIGFSGSPWTLATYMVEGGSSKNFSKVKGWCFQEPAVMHRLLDCVAENVAAYLLAQVESGADCVMIFDTWGGVLSDTDYLEFSLAETSKVVQKIKAKHPNLPVIVFSKNGGRSLLQQACMGCDAIGLDWTADLAKARLAVGGQVALQGNLDPCILYGSPDRIRQAVEETLQAYGSGSGHVFNLGHGIYPDVDPEHVHTLIEAVHEKSPRYHTENLMEPLHG